MWGDFEAGVIWIMGETERSIFGLCTQAKSDLDFLEE
jgi:hypothetical protein